jgi:protoporphyrinogen oxidase
MCEAGVDCDISLFEASDRIGGKLDTRTFARSRTRYEAGIAECYDYSALGADPLRELVSELGLETQPMSGSTIVLEGAIVRSDEEIAGHYGPATLAAVREFRERIRGLMPADQWHPGNWQIDNAHPLMGRPCGELLDSIADPTARHLLEIAVHSDLATETYLIDALNGIKNFALDIPGYVQYYAIAGGMSALAHRIQESIPNVAIHRKTRILQLQRSNDGSWMLRCLRNGVLEDHSFDAVVLALPASQLGLIAYAGSSLRAAMCAHVARYDRPGHYLRAALLFESPFWQQHFEGSWFMIDGFGGACVYDESVRFGANGFGALGFLIAGQHALAGANLGDDELAMRVIEALPVFLRQAATRKLLETRVHRWCAGVSAQPGGVPFQDPVLAHQPGHDHLPGLYVVGDYLFDATLNGVHASAQCATRLLAERVQSNARPPGGTYSFPGPAHFASARIERRSRWCTSSAPLRGAACEMNPGLDRQTSARN